MLFAIDIGNTDVTLGLWDEGQWIHVWRIPTDVMQSEIHYGMRIRNYFFEARIAEQHVQRVVMSCVVPALASKFEIIVLQLFGQTALVLGPQVYAQLPVKTRSPYEIGSDLVANAMAGWTHYKGDCVIVDFGTALTFTTVVQDTIHGVAIAPGIKTAVKALSSNTAKLFDVPLEMPESVFGKDTIQAIQAGILMGYDALVRGMISKIKIELQHDKIPVVATGGLASIITSLHDVLDSYSPTLTLDGLQIIAGLVK